MYCISCYLVFVALKSFVQIPKKVSWEKYIPENSEQWKCQMAVCKLFDEHPIWVKRSLAERLLDEGVQFGDYTLRRWVCLDLANVL